MATVVTGASVHSAPAEDAPQDDNEIPCGKQKNAYDGLVETVEGEFYLDGVEPPSNFEAQMHLRDLARDKFHCGSCESANDCNFEDVPPTGTFRFELIGPNGIGHDWEFTSIDALVVVSCNDC